MGGCELSLVIGKGTKLREGEVKVRLSHVRSGYVTLGDGS
jgi:hypothetical protein